MSRWPKKAFYQKAMLYQRDARDIFCVAARDVLQSFIYDPKLGESLQDRFSSMHTRVVWQEVCLLCRILWVVDNDQRTLRIAGIILVFKELEHPIALQALLKMVRILELTAGNISFMSPADPNSVDSWQRTYVLQFVFCCHYLHVLSIWQVLVRVHVCTTFESSFEIT